MALKITQDWDKILLGVIDGTLDDIIIYLEKEVKQDIPVFSGFLKQSVYGEIKFIGEKTIGKVGTDVEYAEMIEYGGTDDVDPRKLEAWVKSKFAGASEKGIPAIARNLAKKIAEKGIKPQYVFDKVVKDNETYLNSKFDLMKFEVTKKINDLNKKETINVS